jgi:1-acyl-sn-glycerol-3-phosphate acyltransferase
MDAFSWYAMRECFAMKQGIPANHVNMQELFPGDEDFTELFGDWHPGMVPPR